MRNEVALAGCGVKLNVTGGMARSRTLISLTKTFTLQRTKNTQPLLSRRRRRRQLQGTWLMVTAKLGTVLFRNSQGSELL